MDVEYVNRLKDAEKHSYLAKVRSLGIDSCPYSIGKTEWVDDMKMWPPVTFPDVYGYLVDTPGDFTREKLKAFKSLDAYNFVISGWVKPLLVLKRDSANRSSDVFSIIRGEVRPSQRVNEKPHKVWVAVQTDGTVVTGHCTCMAGYADHCCFRHVT